MSLGPWSTDDAGIPMIERIIRMHVQTAVLRGGAKATNKAIREIMSVVRYAVKQEPAPQEGAVPSRGETKALIQALEDRLADAKRQGGPVALRHVQTQRTIDALLAALSHPKASTGESE